MKCRTMPRVEISHYVGGDFVCPRLAAVLLTILLVNADVKANWLTVIETKLRPEPLSEARGDDHFGNSVAIDGEWMAVGVPDTADPVWQQGAVDIYHRQSDGSWMREAVLLSNDANEHDHLGRLVALDGDTLVTAANRYMDGSIDKSVLIHIFLRTDEGWILEEVLDPIPGPRYSFSLAVHGDCLAVSMVRENDKPPFRFSTVYVHRRSEEGWRQESALTTGDIEEADMYGYVVDLSENRMIITSPRAMCESGNRQGAVYVYEHIDDAWIQTERLERPDGASDGGSFGRFAGLKGDLLAVGHSGITLDCVHLFEHANGVWDYTERLYPESEVNVEMSETLSLSEQRLFLTAETETPEGGRALFVFAREAEGWRQRQTLDLPINIGNWARTVLDYDGARLIVGMPWYDGLAGENQGAAGLYSEEDSIFTQEAWLQREDGILSDGDHLGGDIAVQDDWLVAGAAGDYGVAGVCQGSAYLYRRVEGQWVLLQKLIEPDPRVYAGFGTSVAMSGDRFVVASRFAAYVYRLEADEVVLEAHLQAPEGESADGFGGDIAMDGERLIVGVDHADEAGFDAAGAAYIYECIDGQWIEQTRLTASDPTERAYFGISVAIDGERIVVGAYRANEYRGAAYVFRENSGAWSEEVRLTADDYSGDISFGVSVGIEADTIVVGAPKASGYRGRVFVYSLIDGAWERSAVLRAYSQMAGAHFGGNLALRGSRMAIGASSESDDDMLYHGAAYLFYNNDEEWSQVMRLVASDTHPHQHFGGGAVAVDGTQLAVGVPVDGNGSGMMTGAVYCYDVVCPGDVDGDWDVDLFDLTTLLSSYGTLSGATRECGDLDGDGDVDLSDLATLLGCWGETCP